MKFCKYLVKPFYISSNIQKTGFRLVLLFSSLVFPSLSIAANVPSLDTSFGGGDGIAIYDGGNSDSANSMARDASGNIYVAGRINNGTNNDMALWKYDSSGNLDANFGGGGIATYDGGGADWGFSLSLDISGNIYVAGQSSNDTALWKYDSSGSLDTSFGTSGIAIYDGGNADIAYFITQDDSGNIYVIGYSFDAGNQNMVLWKYDSNGSLDTSFGGGDGIVIYDGGNADVGWSLSLDVSGNIYVAGQSHNGLVQNMALWKYDSSGNPVATFGSGGIVTYSAGYSDFAMTLSLDSAENIIVAGRSTNSAGNVDMAIWKFTSSGILDSNFGGGDGITTHDPGGEFDIARSIKLDDKNNIVVAGRSSNNGDMALWRFNSSGYIDASFANCNGYITDNGAAGGAGFDIGVSLDIDDSGNIFVAGYSINVSGNADLALWKYNTEAAFTGTVVGESGTLLKLQGDIDVQGIVIKVTTKQTYVDPVVVAFINDYHGGNSTEVRVRNITSNSFEIFMEEPLGNGHLGQETISYIVMEKGRHTLDSGLVVEAGSVDTASVHNEGNVHGGTAVSFDAFSSTPAVLHTLNSYNNGDFMSTVAHSVSTTGFTIQQEAGGSGSIATTETVGWIAFDTGTGSTAGYAYEIGTGSDGNADGVIDGTPFIISYSSFSCMPQIVVKGNSANGTDGYWARGAGIYSSTSHTVYAEEDEVGDAEKSHGFETFSWVALDPNALIAAANNAPTDINLDNTLVGQSGGINAIVGNLSTSDIDVSDSYIYSLVSGTGDTDNALFNMSGSQIRANDASTMSAGSYSVRIQTYDGHGGTFAKAFIITVNDDVAATVSAISIPDSAMKIGDVVNVSITASEAGLSLLSGLVNGILVTGFGDDGGGNYSAIYTVVEGNTDRAAGDSIPVSFVLTDGVGNSNAAFTTAITQAADSIDANSPVISTVSIANSSMKIGDDVIVNLTAGEAGLSLSAGSINGIAVTSFIQETGNTYSAIYSIAEGDTSRAAGDSIPVSFILQDAAGNNSNTYTTAIVQADDVIDTQRAVVTSVNVPASATYVAGQTLDFTINFNESISIADTASTLGLTIGGSSVNAGYQANTATSITYRYTVQVADFDTDGIVVGVININTDAIKDSVGNDTNLSLNNIGTTTAILVDAVAPVAPGTPDMTTATDTGSLNTDNHTSINTPDFTGTAETDSVINLYAGATLLGRSTATGGTWTITASPLSVGAYDITATATDAAGNTSVASSALSIVILSDLDGDGEPDTTDIDDDNDGIDDINDVFPTDAAASIDTDGDDYPDSWNSGMTEADSTTGLTLDAFPSDVAASIDTDGDDYPDSWNTNMTEADTTTGLTLDAFPSDVAASIDTDGDGYPDSWNTGMSEADSTTDLTLDAFSSDVAASIDTDGDGYPDSWNTGMTETDSTTDLTLDVFPDDASKNSTNSSNGGAINPLLLLTLLWLGFNRLTTRAKSLRI